MTEIEKVKSVYRHQVTFSDCDPATIVYFVRIVQWCDWASEHLWKSVGKPWHSFFYRDGMMGQPLLDVHLSFHAPARHGDEIEITSWIDAFEGRTFTIRHEIRKGDALIGECTEKHAWVVADPDSEKGIRAVSVPDEVRALFHRPVSAPR